MSFLAALSDFQKTTTI